MEISRYGVRKVWRQHKREGFDVARCTLSRLVRDMGLRGSSAANPSNHGQQLRPRHAGWITSTASSRRQGLMSSGSPTSSMSRPGLALFCVAFVIDAYARRSRAGGSRARRTPPSCSTRWSRHCMIDGRSVHHIDRGCQYVSIKYTERLPEAGVWPSIGGVGDSYDSPRRDHRRSQQGRGDPSAWTMAKLRGR